MDQLDRLAIKQSEYQLLGPRNNWACGLASLETALRILGASGITRERLAKAIGIHRLAQELRNLADWLGIDDDAGTDDEDLSRGVRRLGCRARRRLTRRRDARRVWSWLFGGLSTTEPCDSCADDAKHWIVVYGADSDGAWVSDPMDEGSGFRRLRRSTVWRRLWDDDEGTVCLEIEPRSRLERESKNARGLPPCPRLLQLLRAHDPDRDAELVTLREDLHSILSDRSAGKHARDVFRAARPGLEWAISEWSATADLEWVRWRQDRAEDLLRRPPYRVSAREERRVGVDLAISFTAEPLIREAVDPGTGDEQEILTSSRAAASLFKGSNAGGLASAFVRQ